MSLYKPPGHPGRPKGSGSWVATYVLIVVLIGLAAAGAVFLLEWVGR